MIELDQISKRFPGGQLAVDRLCLKVKDHEIFAFLGPNGAGKTTTIRILTTLSLPSEGMAKVAGIDVVVDPRGVRKNIGYVAQDSGVEYCLTGRENLMLQGHLYHMKRKILPERVSELLKLFGLEGVKDRLVSQYSGGMRRKLDIAMALLHRPPLLFLDEPTLGLDPQSRQDLWDYIRKLNRNHGMTIFMTTHYLDEADKLAHRVGILDEGQMKTLDTPEGLKDSIGGDVVSVVFESGDSKALTPELEAKLKALPFVKNLVRVDQECALYVTQGREALPKILQIFDAAGMGIRAATLSRPSLDDVYLKYTGRHFSGEEKTEGGGEWEKWWKPQASGSDDAKWPAAGPEQAGGDGEGKADWNWKDHVSSR